MEMQRWQLQEAKNQLSKVVDHAITGCPQIITRHGKDVVVVVSFSEWTKKASPKPKLVDILLQCPEKDFEIPREMDSPRDLNL